MLKQLARIGSIFLLGCVGCAADEELQADELRFTDALYTSECTVTCDTYRTGTTLVFDVTSPIAATVELVWEERLVDGQPDYNWYDPIATRTVDLQAGSRKASRRARCCSSAPPGPGKPKACRSS